MVAARLRMVGRCSRDVLEVGGIHKGSEISREGSNGLR